MAALNYGCCRVRNTRLSNDATIRPAIRFFCISRYIKESDTKRLITDAITDPSSTNGSISSLKWSIIPTGNLLQKNCNKMLPGSEIQK